MRHQKVLIVSDNEFSITSFIELLQADLRLSEDRVFDFTCHPANQQLVHRTFAGYEVSPLNVKQDWRQLADCYDLIISAHCKQLFPPELIESCACINIHPGYNPYNRGWFPQVFSILNGLPLGATIHEIDAELDHGGIIDQMQVKLELSDTSLSAYQKVQQTEVDLLRRNLKAILDGTYTVSEPKQEGNVNYKKDFNSLCELDLDETLTMREALDRLRALTHPPYKNAYFIDPESGKKIWAEIILSKDDSSNK